MLTEPFNRVTSLTPMGANTLVPRSPNQYLGNVVYDFTEYGGDTMLCMLKSCSKCGGDLILEDGDWRCLQCARYYYGEREDPVAEPEPRSNPFSTWEHPKEESADSRRAALAVDCADSSDGGVDPLRDGTNGYTTRSPRNVNSFIGAKSAADAKWWTRNKQTIEYIEQGLSVHQISQLVDRGQRQIRAVKERLVDLRGRPLGIEYEQSHAI